MQNEIILEHNFVAGRSNLQCEKKLEKYVVVLEYYFLVMEHNSINFLFANLEILLCKAKSNWPQIFSFQDKSSAIAIVRVSEQYGVASLHFFGFSFEQCNVGILLGHFKI